MAPLITNTLFIHKISTMAQEVSNVILKFFVFLPKCLISFQYFWFPSKILFWFSSKIFGCLLKFLFSLQNLYFGQYDGPEMSNFILKFFVFLPKFLVFFQYFCFPSKIAFWFSSKIFGFLPIFLLSFQNSILVFFQNFWFSSKMFVFLPNLCLDILPKFLVSY